MKRRIFLIMVATLALAWKAESVIEVCSLTGSTKTHSRYFRVFTTIASVERTWIEEVMVANGRNVPNTRWFVMSHRDWTLIGGIHGSAGTPIAFSIQFLSLAELREKFSEKELLTIAEQFLTGDKSIQQQAKEAIYQR